MDWFHPFCGFLAWIVPQPVNQMVEKVVILVIDDHFICHKQTSLPQDEVDVKPQRSQAASSVNLLWKIPETSVISFSFSDFQRLIYFIRKIIRKSRHIFVSQSNSVRGSKAIRVYVTKVGNLVNCHNDILERLGISPQDQVPSEDQSDVFIAFVPIVSRAGTDIEAALQNVPKNQPVVLVLLHHTFNENYIVPESSRAVRRSNVLAVDFLFHEDRGILNCLQNTKALEAIEKNLEDIKCNQK